MKNSTFSAQVANNLLTLLQGYSKTIRLLLVMLLTLTVTTNVWGEDFEMYSGTITEGDYLIVYNNGAMNNTVSSSRLQYTDVTVSNNKISNPDASLIWHIAPNGSYWTIYNADVNKYAAGTGAKNKAQLLASGTDNKSLWTVSGTSTYEFVNKANKAADVNSNLRRNGTYGFACYATGTGGALTLYKKVTAVQTVAVTGVSLNQTSLTLTAGNSETLTATVLPNNATDKTITWSTSNSSVATVRNGEVTAVAEGSATITVTTNDGNKTATCTVTVTPKPKYTVTLDAGPGTCAASVTESSAGAGVNLPTPTICDGWTFAGWATSAVATETSSKPATLLTGTYKPTSNITLYAVYQRTEETEGNGGTENVTRSYTFSNFTAGTQYAENEVHKLDNDVTLTTTDCHFTTELRIYSSSTYNGYVVSNKLPGRIVSIGFNAGNKVDAIDVFGSTNGTDWTKVGQVSVTSTSYKNYTLSFDETDYTYFKLDVAGANQVRLKSITITWESTTAGGTITTTYYHSTPNCGGSTPDPDPTYYTITLNPNYPEGKKGTFIDTVGHAVDGDLKISWLGETKTTPIAQLYSSISLDGYIFEGWYEITAEGEKNREKTGTITRDTTFYARWKVPYTVTFNAGTTGECNPQSITETTADGITLPTATLTDCGDWVFLGWAEAAIASETTTPPASIFAGGSTYKPTGNITLYAIYKRVEGGGGESATLSFADKAQRTEYTEDIQVWAQNGITLTNNKAESTNAVGDYADPARFYAHSQIIISAPGAITQIVADCDESKYATALVSSIGTDASASGITATITPTTQSETYEITLTGQTRFNSITVTYGGGLSTPYYHSNPYCQRCENILTIAKGTETNGTFTLNISGDIETCETEVSVVVEPTPANHYHIGSVTATTPTTGGAPTVTDNDNGTYTITYAANSTGTSTINVTFAEDAKATIKLYELGVLTTIATEYVGDKYTLPSTSSQLCGTKTLVGWSTVAFAETDTRPTENYYGISTQITLAETQTFYAVFAQSSGGGDGNGDYARVTEALDDWSGDYLIAYNDQTFADGSTGGKEGMGVNGNKVDLSSYITNNTIPASIGDLYNVTLVTVDGGYVLQTKDSKYNYQSSNASGLTATDNIDTAKKYPLTITFNSESDIAIAHSHGAVFQYNKGDNGYFRFYKDGGQQPIYLFKKSGTAATYTGYTTSCAVITGIEVANPKTDFKQYDEFVFGGTVYAVDENDNRIDVTSSATFSGYDMKKAGKDTVTVTYNSHSTTYEITINDVDEWLLTWNVNGATNTGLAPTHVIKGNAIGTLPKPKGETPAGCEKKTFVGWTESNEVNADGSNITYITSETVPSKNTTYYAVFATPSGISGVGGYVKLTETPADLSGEYLIVYEDGAVAFNGGLTTLDAASNTISVTITDNTIEATNATNAAKFTIAKHGTAYLITSASEYHIGQTSDANGLLSNKSTTYTNNISITDGNADIIASGGAYLRYNKTSGDTRFRYYKSSTYTGQQPIALYKKSGSSASYTDYTTGCHDVTITYYGFNRGYTTNCGGSDLDVITQRVNSAHTIPSCADITDPTTLGRTFLNMWKDQNGKVHQPGETFIVTEDITLYAQWKLETTGDVELSATQEDLATTDIVVTGGHTLTIPDNETITINSLTLKGGLLVEDDSVSGYAMPVVNIPTGATLVRKNTTINLDLVVNNDSWYPFAVPFEVENTAANVNYINSTLKEYANVHNGYGKYYRILEYNGALRAEKGLNNDSNWVHVGRTDVKLMPGKGYAISAVPAAGDDTVTIRITMNVDNAWLANGEQDSITVKETTTTRNAVAVAAHTGTAATEHRRHAGWNFVANPYLTNFTANENISGAGYINGKIIINDGNYSYGGDEVPYVTIPTYNFAHYYQLKLSEATLSPAYSFFVQVGEGDTMSFDVAGRQAAPAGLAARSAEERPVKMDVDITLSDNHSSDQTGIIISDRYSEAYEIGRDLEKLFGSAYNLSVYTLMADNTPLAFQALAIRSNMQVIPVGYRAPEQGEYTFRLNEATSSIDLLNEQYEQLVLVDYQTGELTNLLISDYTFYSERTQADNRFAIYAVPRQNAPTDLPNAIGQDKQAQKIIHNGHLYILRDGNVYNGNGQIVK